MYLTCVLKRKLSKGFGQNKARPFYKESGRIKEKFSFLTPLSLVLKTRFRVSAEPRKRVLSFQPTMSAVECVSQPCYARVPLFMALSSHLVSKVAVKIKGSGALWLAALAQSPQQLLLGADR